MLSPKAGETIADCTAGLGGHAADLARAAGGGVRVVLNDVDAGNLVRATAAVGATGAAAEVVAVRGNFAGLPRELRSRGIIADVVLADLGFSSNQMDDGSRGFSFMRDGPLDMRLDPSAPTSAADLVNSLPEAELARIIWELGEDRESRRIARKLVQARTEQPITTTGRLAEVVRSACAPFGRAPGQIDPATRTFQALRIAVNDELGALEALLGEIAQGRTGRLSWLSPGARIGVISFHSLEDRMVKRAFGGMVKESVAEDVSGGPVVAADDEVETNPRSRSAKLRVIRFCGG